MPVLPNDIRGTRFVTGLVPAFYDRVEITYPTSTTEVYTFQVEGNTIAVVTLTYNGSDELISAERTA